MHKNRIAPLLKLVCFNVIVERTELCTLIRCVIGIRNPIRKDHGRSLGSGDSPVIICKRNLDPRDVILCIKNGLQDVPDHPYCDIVIILVRSSHVIDKIRIIIEGQRKAVQLPQIVLQINFTLVEQIAIFLHDQILECFFCLVIGNDDRRSEGQDGNDQKKCD